jgi:hypothetical protein
LAFTVPALQMLILAMSLILGLVVEVALPAQQAQGMPAGMVAAESGRPVAVPTAVNCATAPYSRLVNGINIDKTCQRAYFVSNGKIIRRVRVSTGKPG